MKAAFRFTVMALAFLVQVLFLLAIFRENKNSYLISIFVASLCLLVFYTYKKKLYHQSSSGSEPLIHIIWVMLGTIITYLLSRVLGLGPVLGASITGLMASLIPELNKSKLSLKQIPPAIYCGAFVGMSSPTVANDLQFVLVASFFSGVILVVSKNILAGIGGRLGAVAFTGVLITYIMMYLLWKM